MIKGRYILLIILDWIDLLNKEEEDKFIKLITLKPHPAKFIALFCAAIAKDQIKIAEFLVSLFTGTNIFLSKTPNVDQLVRSMIAKDESLVYKKDELGNTAIHYVAATASIEIIKIFMTRDKSLIKSSNYEKMKPIHYAARCNESDIVRFLLKKDKSMIEATDGNGWKPIHHASNKNNQKMAALLLKML